LDGAGRSTSAVEAALPAVPVAVWEDSINFTATGVGSAAAGGVSVRPTITVATR
jgi:hypothetical protein